jgi:hypothetical protein
MSQGAFVCGGYELSQYGILGKFRKTFAQFRVLVTKFPVVKFRNHLSFLRVFDKILLQE